MFYRIFDLEETQFTFPSSKEIKWRGVLKTDDGKTLLTAFVIFDGWLSFTVTRSVIFGHFFMTKKTKIDDFFQ